MFSNKQKYWIRNNAIIICIVIISIMFLSNMFFPYILWDKNDDRGTFGDQFGAVNALFSGIAFAGLIYTIVLQRSDLRNQRKELFLQRKEMRLNRQEMIEQNLTLSLQRFENTFFQMMELQQNIVNNLEVTDTSLQFDKQGNKTITQIYKGTLVFDRMFRHGAFMRPSIAHIISHSGINGYCSYETISIFDHYFRHLYTILDYIDQSNLLSGDNEGEIFMKKYSYAKILRATLSRYELVFLYYNGLSTNGRDKLKPLLEKYSMLNNLNKELLSLSKDNIEKYKDSENKDIISYLKQYNYSLSDFYFNMTEDKDDKEMYHLSAFYHGDEELEAGRQKLRQFNSVMDKYANI